MLNKATLDSTLFAMEKQSSGTELLFYRNSDQKRHTIQNGQYQT